MSCMLESGKIFLSDSYLWKDSIYLVFNKLYKPYSNSFFLSRKDHLVVSGEQEGIMGLYTLQSDTMKYEGYILRLLA